MVKRMLNKVLLITNPVAGKGHGEKYAEKLKDVLELNHNSDVEIKITKEEHDATEWSKNATKEGFDTVICLGGDGTVSETVNGILQADDKPIFGFIPMGTVNDLGRALGYNMNVEKAIEDFKEASLDKLDVGKVNNQVFVNVIALGPIAEEVMATNSDDKNKFGVLAYVRDGIKAFFTDKGYEIRVTSSDGTETDIKTNLLFIGLTNSIGGVEFMVPEASYNDGKGYLAAIKGHTPISTIRAGLEVGLANLDADNIFRLSDTKFKIEALDNEKVITNVDGDNGPELPLEIEIISNAIDVLITGKS